MTRRYNREEFQDWLLSLDPKKPICVDPSRCPIALFMDYTSNMIGPNMQAYGTDRKLATTLDIKAWTLWFPLEVYRIVDNLQEDN